METLLIEIRQPKGLNLLKDLEALDIITILKSEKSKPKIKYSEIFAGSISAEEADKLNEYVKQSREEWERNF